MFTEKTRILTIKSNREIPVDKKNESSDRVGKAESTEKENLRHLMFARISAASKVTQQTPGPALDYKIIENLFDNSENKVIRALARFFYFLVQLLFGLTIGAIPYLIFIHPLLSESILKPGHFILLGLIFGFFFVVGSLVFYGIITAILLSQRYIMAAVSIWLFYPVLGAALFLKGHLAP